METRSFPITLRMKKSFDVGFIGSGFAAEFHLAALRKVYDVKIQVVGAYSPTKSNLEEFCTKHALEAFSSAEELISRVDVVHICTPPSTHESLCIQALKQHKHNGIVCVHPSSEHRLRLD